MILRRMGFWLLVALGGPMAVQGQAHQMAPGSSTWTPNQILNLSHWSLTIPVADSSQTASPGAGGQPGEARQPGEAQTIKADALLQGYTSSFFYVTPDGGVRFWSPATGATTPHSTHPRSELRETPDARWYSNTPSRLTATLSVNQVPAGSGTIVVGQIHGEGKVPLLLLFYSYDSTTRTGSVRVGIHNAGDTEKKDYPLAQGIPLDRKFSYVIEVGGTKVLQVSMPGVAPVRVPIDASWDGIGLYFKAGNYVQSDAHATFVSGDGGMTTFYALKAEHRW